MKRDLRKYARSTNFRLLVGFILILFMVGDGLIYAFYGEGAALMGLVCLVGGLLPLGLIGGTLWLMDYLVRRANE